MSDAVSRPIRRFNPGTLQSDEEVIEQFVVRQHQLDSALEVLLGNIDSPSCQHVLIVAPRGRGKTMLLARVAAELRTDSELSRHLLPVRFMEESHEIFDMADLWLETLFHLGRETTQQDPQLAHELRVSHAALTARWRDRAIEESARATVLSAADRLGKKLVLMVENLQSLVENANTDLGWKLRAVLQSEPQIVLLASSTSRFGGLDEASQPFFEMFRILTLEPLSAEECGRLWTVVNGERISGHEIRPLQILTGGSPRLLVIVAGFGRHRFPQEMMDDLVELVDEHTEYFRGHLEALGKTERRVYIAVIDLWRPSRSREIAARARMDIRTASTMLGRLVNRGAVMVEGNGRKRLYSATERLYGIYYKLRRERDGAAAVRNLIQFMSAFYGKDGLGEMFSGPIWEAARSPATREGIQQAAGAFPRHPTSLDTFRSAYAAYGPRDPPAMRWVLKTGAADLVGFGVPAHAVVEVLTGDQEKSEEFEPLVVALRQLAGSEVRASREVLEVAHDVRRCMESKQAGNPPTDSQFFSTCSGEPR